MLVGSHLDAPAQFGQDVPPEFFCGRTPTASDARRCHHLAVDEHVVLAVVPGLQRNVEPEGTPDLVREFRCGPA